MYIELHFILTERPVFCEQFIIFLFIFYNIEHITAFIAHIKALSLTNVYSFDIIIERS